MQMLRDIPLVINLLLLIKKARNFKVTLKLRSQKAYPVCTIMMLLVIIKSIMKLEVFIISTFAVLALLM